MSSETEAPLYLAYPENDRKVLRMVLGKDDVTIGRFGVFKGGDISEFDALPIDNAVQNPDLGEQSDVVFSGEDGPFTPPVDSLFPTYMAALRQFQAEENKPRVARIDTEESYGAYVADQAVKELGRRIDDLQQALEAHRADPLAHPHEHRDGKMIAANRATILGAAEAIADLKKAATTDDATDKFPSVPVNILADYRGSVKCWRDGNAIVVSIKFCTVEGEPRIATMADTPDERDANDAARGALKAGVSPITVFGAIEDLAAVVCGKALIKDTARAALAAQRRADVVFGKDPVLLIRGGDESRAPLAALMSLMQQAEAGDAQAQRELDAIKKASSTKLGQKVAAPVLAEAEKRLALGRQQKQGIAGFIIDRVRGWLK